MLLTGVVKDHLGARAGAATGAYVVAMMVGATVSSAARGAAGRRARRLVVLARRVGGARGARGRGVDADGTAHGGPADAGPRTGLPWRTGFARLTACYQAGTSLMFYGWLTWLAPYYEAHGWPPARAGLLLAVWSVAQIPAALLAPAMAERRRRWSGSGRG